MRLALFGDPVEHSRSPAIHEAALAAMGLDGRYEVRRVDRAGLAGACAEVRDGTLDGANVTMPWKAEAAAACDNLSTEAARIAAVNTLVGSDGILHGHTTDVTGLRAVLGRFPEAAVVVLGTGSAAAAALVAAEGRRATLVGRSRERAEALVARVGAVASVSDWGDIPGRGLLVNATPLGMNGEALPERWEEGKVGLVDLAYGPAVTPAVALARRIGIPVADGLDVLVAQAALSFELWTGLPAPVEVMERAARR